MISQWSGTIRTIASMIACFVLLAGQNGLPVSAASPAAQEGTPAATTLKTIAMQTVDMNGKDKLWQVNRVTALPQDQDAEEFEVGLGFILAHEIPLTVTVGKRGDPQILAVGQAIAIENRDKVKVSTPGDLLGSFYTLELIEPLDVNNSLNSTAVGQPFSTTGDDYTLTLTSGTAAPAEIIPLDAGDTPGLILALTGELTYDRGDGTATTLAAGVAGTGAGSVELTAGADGATFVAVTLATGEPATPEPA